MGSPARTARGAQRGCLAPRARLIQGAPTPAAARDWTHPNEPHPPARSALPGRNLDGADCVLWFNVGLTHVVRTEDWPVMPVEHLTFSLKPWGERHH